MEWYQMIAYSLTNGIRVYMCFFLVAILLKLEKPPKSMIWLSLICGLAVAVLSLSPLPQIGTMTFEVLVILFILHWKYQCETRICGFLTVCFEIAVALWDFLFCVGFEILFQYSTLDGMIQKYMVPIWAVRLLMVAFMLYVALRGENSGKILNQVSSILAVAGMFCVLMLSEQSVVPLPDDQFITWIIFSIILLSAVILYRVNRQYEIEKEIVRLKTDQAEILERDYQALRRTYADNAKLYHDLNNHIEVIYQCLSKGDNQEAMRYCEDLRTPVREISQTVWTGDKAIDYLISSKMTLAEQEHIKTTVNIEYPHNTNIRSVDLTTILGNLLDNALEAVEIAPDNLRFLNLTVRRINAMLIIKVENGCSEIPVQEDGKWLTSKTDKAFHSWGLKSVQSAAERYDGTINTEYKDSVFKSVVTLSFQPIKTE